MRQASRTRSVHRLIALTAAALIIAWLLPGRPVPIYDGVGAPDEPYRYVSVPAGVVIRTKPPTVAKVTVPVDNGVASVIQLATAEQGPQAEVDITDEGLSVPPADGSASSLTATLTPLAPDSGATRPEIDGNIYRLGWSAGSSTPRFINHGSDLIYLRATVGPPPKALVLYRRGADAPWSGLATELAGADIYSALIQGPGDYALTRRGLPAASGATPSGAAHHAVQPSLVIAIVLILLMVGIVLSIRLLRIRRAQ
ncbi:MAG: hypothetical protein QOH56_3928 [Pseudonocardiales bacterium]|jgi:hypothetical protein|nr:hypothetical protein [Pseudonocardiales bacterium]